MQRGALGQREATRPATPISLIRRLLEYRPRGPAVAIAWVLILATCAVGFAACYLSGPHLDYGSIFLLPSIVAGWYLGLTAGILAVGISAAAWVIAAVAAEPAPPMWAVIVNAISRFAVFLMIVGLLARVRKLLERLGEQSRTDALTGIGNRRALLERGQHDMEAAMRNGSPTSLLFMDVDNFKVVNDRFGHATGDQVVREVGGTLAAIVRKTDFAARLGGDEFAVLLNGSNETSARLVAEEIREAVGALFRAKSWPLSLSIGIATAAGGTASFEGLLDASDRAMYSAKESGKDVIVAGPATGGPEWTRARERAPRSPESAL